MRAVVCRELGPPSGLVVEERPTPEPGPGEVRIAVGAAGVNFADSLLVEGKYQVKPAPPFVPGMEVAGVVEAIGEGVQRTAVGDRIAALSIGGAFAERVVTGADTVVPVPDGVSLGVAASVVQAYGTTLFALERRGALRAGEVLLVLGAGGGVGSAAVDVGRALGATVIAGASSPEKVRAAAARGAHHTIDYGTEDLKTRARELSGRGGVDVVYDPVGGELAEPALRALTDFGRYLVIGFTAGIPRLATNQVLLRNRSVVGVDWGAWAFAHLDESGALLARTFELVAAGELQPVAPTEHPLAEAPQVLADFQARRIVGKHVLVP